VEGALSRVQELCDTLADSCDTIRKHYWHHVRDSVTGKYASAAAAAGEFTSARESVSAGNAASGVNSAGDT
jgi:hypothetical protein